MGIADFGAGVQGALEKMMADRIAQEHYADAMRQQQFNNTRLTANDHLQQQLRQDTLNENKRNHDIADQDKRIGLANTLGDQIPENTFLPPTDPGVGILRTGGRGSLLKEQQERPEVLTGPLLPGDTGAAKQQGFIKTASAKQMDSAALQKDKAADNTRQQAGVDETARHNRAMEQRPVAARGVASDPDDVGAIVQAIKRGEQPPETTGLYRMGPLVRAGLAREGYPLATAQQDFRATTRHFATLNGPQQTRMRQAVDNAYHSLDVIEDLSSKWQGSSFPLLNRASLAAAKAGLNGPEAQKLATNLEAQIADVASELGNVYMGGNSPTDHALAMAGKNLQADWSESQLKGALELARRNLQIRQNSIRNTGVLGASPQNPYAGPQTAAPGPQAAPAGAPAGPKNNDPLGIR